MQRITISVGDTLYDELDDMRQERGYQTRSEAVRDLVRDGIERWREERTETEFCIANLSYVFDRRIRNLAHHLTEIQNAHHDLVVASTAVRLDHFHSMESVMLKGTCAAVRSFANRVRAERGVRSGSINLLSVEPHDNHDDPGFHHHSDHAHLSPMG